MRKFHVSRSTIFSVLDLLKFFLILVLLLMFVQFNARIAMQSEETQKLTESTNKVVKSQADILTAIKQVTDDTRITAVQQTAIIICMLQVPIDERTTDLQTQCRERAMAADADSGSGTGRNSIGTSDPSSQITPNSATPQRDTSQPAKVDEEPPESTESESGGLRTIPLVDGLLDIIGL
jgi:hypothetical protein